MAVLNHLGKPFEVVTNEDLLRQLRASKEVDKATPEFYSSLMMIAWNSIHEMFPNHDNPAVRIGTVTAALDLEWHRFKKDQNEDQIYHVPVKSSAYGFLKAVARRSIIDQLHQEKLRKKEKECLTNSRLERRLQQFTLLTVSIPSMIQSTQERSLPTSTRSSR